MTVRKPTPAPKDASTRERKSFSAVWVVPIVAALIAIYLGWQSYAQHGPTISIAFESAEGLVVGQTQLKYKAVPLGTVSSIALDSNHNNVVVRAQMSREADKILTENTRFWVVRPRFNSAGISGVETIVSGAYIQVDPGNPEGKEKTSFVGLDEPPSVRSDEPGTTFKLEADELGQIAVNSPVFYRSVNVGEVMGFDIGDGFGPIKLDVFVRTPYDKLVRNDSRFWNVSGVSVGAGPAGIQIQLQSIQSLLSGGIAFYTPITARKAPPAGDNARFVLHATRQEAETAAARPRVSYVAYFKDSVKSMPPGTPVTIYGIQVGEVTDVALSYNAKASDMTAKVSFNVQPERAFSLQPNEAFDALAVTTQLVDNGLRARIDAGGIVPGQKSLSLTFVPKAAEGAVVKEGDSIVMPVAASSSLEGIASALSDITTKLNQIPFAEIGTNLNKLLVSADETIGGPEMKQSLKALSATMIDAQDLVRKANKNLTPTLDRLPEISKQLESTLTRANSVMGSVDQKSDLQRNAKRTMDQVNEAARSIRLLADYLSRHPESIIKGRAVREDKPNE